MVGWLDSILSLGFLSAATLTWQSPRENTSLQAIPCVHNTTTFDDLVACFENYTVSMGYYSDETYDAAQPTAEERRGWEDLVSALLSVDGNCTSLVVPSSILGIYDVSLFTDSAGPQYCVVSESSSVDSMYAKGWGLVVVQASREAVKRDIHLAAPHPVYDMFTPGQAGALFTSTGARSLLISGRTRTAILSSSDCVIPASNATIYYKTDPAHDVAEPFFSASKAIRAWQHANGGCPAQSCAFIQMHGKGVSSCPTDTMFISSGLSRSAWYTDAVDRPIKRLKTELLAAFPAWNVSLPSDSACGLSATENVFGRLVNGIDEQLVCTDASTSDLATGEFIHIEQAIVARGSAAYAGWTAAFLAAFAPSS